MKKNLKKILAAGLAASMVMGISVPAFAKTTINAGKDNETEILGEQDLTQVLDKKPIVQKTYVVNNGTAPAEKFTYKFTGVSYVDNDGNIVEDANIPAINDVKIEFDAISETTSKSVELTAFDLENYGLGVYTYKVEEKAEKTAGVTYSEEDLYLVVTILRDEISNKHYVAAMHYQTLEDKKKENGFTNTYDAGTLEVTKKITGNMADMKKEFLFKITLTPENGTEIKSEIGLEVGGNKPTLVADASAVIDSGKYYLEELANGSYVYTVKLGDGATAKFTNIPATVTYDVKEDSENYTPSSVWSELENNTHVIDKAVIIEDDPDTENVNEYSISKDIDKVEFTNTLTSGVDTGISLDALPYLMMLSMSGLGALGIAGKKRKEEDEI